MATIDFRVSDDSSTLSYWASANMEDGNPKLIASTGKLEVDKEPQHITFT